MRFRFALVAAPILALWACSDDETSGNGGNLAAPDGGAIVVPDAGPVVVIPDAGPSACPIPFDATVTATLSFTVDNERKVWVNGVALDEGAPSPGYGSPGTFEVTLFKNPTRKNVIAIDGLNTSSQGGADRGILADLRLADAHVVSDAQWKISAASSATWTEVGFDDGGWADAIAQGPNGMSPWNTVAAIDASAKWIWLFDSAVEGSQKTDNQHAYARRSFYLDLQGQPVNAPVACP